MCTVHMHSLQGTPPPSPDKPKFGEMMKNPSSSHPVSGYITILNVYVFPGQMQNHRHHRDFSYLEMSSP